MTDRELLELAAKAAGFEFNSLWFDAQLGLLVWEPPTNFESRDWNPLTDDGDALRLAVKLNLTLRCYFGNVVAQTATPGGLTVYITENTPTDPLAATRRAIVRAAAAIGETK